MEQSRGCKFKFYSLKNFSVAVRFCMMQSTKYKPLFKVVMSTVLEHSPIAENDVTSCPEVLYISTLFIGWSAHTMMEVCDLKHIWTNLLSVVEMAVLIASVRVKTTELAVLSDELPTSC